MLDKILYNITTKYKTKIGGKMLSKNNLKHILILAVGFLWYSLAYLAQEQELLKIDNLQFVNIIAILYGSLSMGAGILIFSILYKKDSKHLKKYYFISTILAVLSLIIFFAIKNKISMSINLCLTAMFGTSGFGIGYHFSMLATNVEKQYRGRVFAIGYGIGTIVTYLITLLPEKIYSSYISLTIIIPLIIINLILIWKNKQLENIEEEKYSLKFKKYFIIISVVILAMSLLSAISTDVIALKTIDMKGGFATTRVSYCLGLILAGFLADKKKEIFEILTIASFIFCLFSLFLLEKNISPEIIGYSSYFFVGFFVLFRTLTFVNLIDKKRSIVFTSAYGLMYSRIMEGLFVLGEKILLDNFLILTLVEAIMLAIVLCLYMLIYKKDKNKDETDKIKEIIFKYNLSPQEEKVLRLLVQDLINKEIADQLSISVNTVRNHVANIYKKTGMKKKELKEIYYLRTE